MPTVAEVLALAARRHQAGEVATAERIYREVLRFDPDQPDALLLLGLLLGDQGKAGEAAALIERSARARPDEAARWQALAEARGAAGQAAADTSRLALCVDPAFAATWTNIGAAALAHARDRAARAFARVVRLEPAAADAHHHLGLALAEGTAARGLAFRRAVLIDPGHERATLNLAVTMQGGRGAGEGALAALPWHRRSATLRPLEPEAWLNLASGHAAAGHPAEARDLGRRPLLLAPGHAVAHRNYGNALQGTDRWAAGGTWIARALRIAPDDAESANALAVALQAQGRIAEASDAFRRALVLSPVDAEILGNWIFFLNYCPGVDDAAHGRANRRWAMTLERPGSLARPMPRPALPQRRRLRLGYISPEFRFHGFLTQFQPVLAHHDRSRFEIFCYADVARPDAQTAELKRLAEHWIDIHGLDEDAQARRVAGDRLDLLVMLTGWLPRHRSLFGRRLAPLQITYLNHLTTTGLRTMDWRVTDDRIDPPDLRTEPYNSERLVRLLGGFVCFTPPRHAPDPGPAPLLKNGYVTFGSFNYIAKVHDGVIDVWAEILRALPTARFLLKALNLSDPDVAARYRRLFAARGVDPARVEIVGMVPSPADNLATVARADIALDPFPFNGGISTCEVLWMGLPLVCL
jgi:predicted O-linked N-acetylglucosamine transferase (SPINDLY family)